MGSIPGLGRSPGGGHATHSSVLAWKISWTEEPLGPQSVESQRLGHDLSNLARTHAVEGYLVCFPVLAVTNKAAINSMCRFL